MPYHSFSLPGEPGRYIYQVSSLGRLSQRLFCCCFRLSARPVRLPELVAKAQDCRDIENLHHRQTQEDTRISAGEVHQKAQAAIAQDIELEKIARASQLPTQPPDHGKEDEIEDHLIECRRLSPDAALQDGPGEGTRQAKGVATQQIAHPSYRLAQRERRGKDVAGRIGDMLPALDKQHARVTAKKAACPCLAAVPEVGQVFDESGRAKEKQHA